MAFTKPFKLGSVQVRVRSAPSIWGTRLRWLNANEQIMVDPSSRREADNYVWWQHSEGWSAERSSDGKELYMFPVDDSEEESPVIDTTSSSPVMKVFVVGDEQVRIRSAATLRGLMIRWMNPGETKEVELNSRTESDGYVWWKHNEGWSAEKNLAGTEIYLADVTDETDTLEEIPQQPTDTTSIPTKPTESTTTTATTTPATKGGTTTTSTTSTTTDTTSTSPKPITYQAGTQQVRIRSAAGLHGTHLGWIDPGVQVQVVANSRTVANNYVWWQHDKGWSAEKNVSDTETYLYPPELAPKVPAPVQLDANGLPDTTQLPDLNTLFERLPVDLNQTAWWQYYGNNVFAYNIWRDGKRWYSYAQALHGGLDFGNSNVAVPIYAGIANGTVGKIVTNVYSPNGIFVNTGDYTLIYGHVRNPRVQAGDVVTRDTVMGEFDLGGQNHLHFEVRYKNKWIINPLLLFSEADRNAIIAKFPASTRYFYKDATWTQWQSPMDQPVITLGSTQILGPHSR